MTRRQARSVALMLGSLLGVSALGFGSGRAGAAVPWSTLRRGQTLSVGQKIVSPNGQYTLIQQDDGNLVEYGPDGRALWASDTFGSKFQAVMQKDGNLVVYSASGK